MKYKEFYWGLSCGIFKNVDIQICPGKIKKMVGFENNVDCINYFFSFVMYMHLWSPLNNAKLR